MAKSSYRPERLIAKRPEGDVPLSRPKEVNETSEALRANVLGRRSCHSPAAGSRTSPRRREL